jgi:pilus assembly protein CpaE
MCLQEVANRFALGFADGLVLRTQALKTGARKARLRVRARRPANDAAQAAANDASADEEELELVSDAGGRTFVLNEPIVANDRLATNSEEESPPFDPPDEDDILGLGEVFEDEVLEADAPFDAPDDIEECVGAAHVAPQRDLPVIELVAPPPAAFQAAPPRVEPKAPAPVQRKPDLPVPPISVLASWDRADSGDVFAAMVGDKRLARAEMESVRGGLDGACAAMDDGVRPDLVIVDTTLSGAEMLDGVGRVQARLGPGAKLIVISAVNDIGVLRSLNARGVAAYLMAPVSAEELTQSVCALFAHSDRARVIAVMGARGGVGASTVAQNLAWTIAERLDAPTALVDLDVGFGAAAANFKLEPAACVTDLMGEADEEHVERALTRASERLSIAASPANPALSLTVETPGVEAMLAHVRRASAFVVLDLPHVWTAWMKQALISADEVVLIAGPDLASLRNSDNLVKQLRDVRAGKGDPILALSMTGVPKRPEISLKDFSESISIAPTATFAFDPELYGLQETSGRLLCDEAPKSKQAQTIEALACALTGRAVTERKIKHRKRVAPQPAPEPAPLTLTAENVVAAPPAAAEEPVQVEAPAPAPAPAPHERRGAAKDRDQLSGAERAYVERARRRALGELEARRVSKARRRASGRTMVRFLGVAAAAYALGLVTLWSSQQQQSAAAAPARAEAVVQPVAASVDPIVAMTRDYAEAMALLAQSDARGVALLRRTAEAGFPLAQYRLAKLYESGDGVAVDIVGGVFIAGQGTDHAAGGGNVRAMHDLGFYFARGDGAPLDEAAAFRWFRQAAEFGMADSQYNLGILYQQGRGVSADMPEALFWFTLAASNGDAAAQERVIQLGAELSAIHLEQARARAEGFTPRTPNAMANGDWTPTAVVTPPPEATSSERVAAD